MDKDNIISLLSPLNDWMLRARAAMESGDYLKAAHMYLQALKMQEHPVIRMELAYAYFSMHCYETVDNHVYEALQYSPLDGEWCFLIAMCALNRDDLDFAKKALEAYLQLDPRGEHVKSVVEMLETFPWHRGEAPKRGHRAQVLLRQAGQDADKVFRACRCDPTGGAFLRMAELMLPRDVDSALHYLQKALQKPLNKRQHQRHQLLQSRAYHVLGHFAESEAAWQKSALLCDHFDELDSMVEAAADMGKLPWAEELVEEWLAAMPHSVHLLRLHMQVLEGMGKNTLPVRRQLKHVDPFNAALRLSGPEAKQETERKRAFIRERVEPLALDEAEE